MEELLLQGEQLALNYIGEAYDVSVDRVLEVLELEDEEDDLFVAYDSTLTDYMSGFEAALIMLNIDFGSEEEE